MERALSGLLLPLLLLSASLLNWSLISLIYLLIYFSIQFTNQGIGFNFWRLHVSTFTVIFSLLTITAQVIFHILWYIVGRNWSLEYVWWARLIGLMGVQTWKSTSAAYFIIIQLTAALVAYSELDGYSLFRRPFHWWSLTTASERIGYHVRGVCFILLPLIQLIVGISHPSWISLPFFVCSCVGLVDWSLTSNFLGLLKWWRPLFIYSCFTILLLHIYQLPVDLPQIVIVVADFIGLYKVSEMPEWPEISSGCSLVLFHFMISFVKFKLEEMNTIYSMNESCMTEQLLPSSNSFLFEESISGIRHANLLLKGPVFGNFSINIFAYGFPVVLLSLAFWSFHFASICAFGLLAYVGYVLWAFPSLFHLHRLNGLLLVFILLWAISTYIFNVAFKILNKELWEDMHIWETIGLWHYSVPGFFLLAQFCLGVLVAIGNLVNNSVFMFVCDVDGKCSNDDHSSEEKEDTKVLIVAMLAWTLHKSSRAITLVIIFLIAIKPGIIHAVYMVFFLVYMLKRSVILKIRQYLILLGEVHFLLLYMLQLNQISEAVEHSGSTARLILSQLGLSSQATFGDFFKIGLLLCFCAVRNHGPKMLLSFSSIIQHVPHPPFGFSILKAGLSKSVLMSVYTSLNDKGIQSLNCTQDNLVATYISDIRHFFLSMYHSYGTYVASLTILSTVYLATPNYISFGYLFFLLFWLIGRQVAEKTEKRLWFPLKVYATLVFIFIYSLSISSTLQKWVSTVVNLYPDMGFNPEVSLFNNIWESLAVLVVMQLYSYERRLSKHDGSCNLYKASELGLLGFVRRLLIWHSEKILYVAVFYASLSPISAFGILYLLGLIICSILPKASRIPSKLFLVYTGVLVTFEYLFQLWGKYVPLFPGQEFYKLSVFLGFKVFDCGFWGIESGLRGKVLVIVSCTLQYNVFHWLNHMPRSVVHTGVWEEPCQLFFSPEHASMEVSVPTEEKRAAVDSTFLHVKPHASFSFDYNQTEPVPSESAGPEGSDIYSLGYMWGNSKESRKWNKKRILSLRKERFEMQKTTLKVYMKFWIENLFKLRGLEINMIALLVASFSVLNIISMFYIICVVIFILLNRQILIKSWPLFVMVFASILVIEYFTLLKTLISWAHDPSEVTAHCRDCWNGSSLYFSYCEKCWLGIIVDDSKLLISYFMVFMFSSFKLRSDHLTSFSESHTYREMISQQKNASVVWRELSFETKGLWTLFDYLRLYCYCHLLDIVLALILITGTLEFDVLHLGYLAFALVFFRMRLDILKKKNKIFRFLRLYNFVVITLSLAYQSPFLGKFNSEKRDMVDYIYEIIGLYKYDYGFRIASRSAFVEIVIFLLVSMQSYIFQSREFEYVARYLEAEQIGAIVREQEKRADWKTAQLQHIRKSEEQKRQRNLQVEKMKSEMLNLQIQLNCLNSMANFGSNTPVRIDVKPSGNSSLSVNDTARSPSNEGDFLGKEDVRANVELPYYFDFSAPATEKIDLLSPVGSNFQDSPTSLQSESSSTMEYMKFSSESLRDKREFGARNNTKYLNTGIRDEEKSKRKGKENPLISAVHLIGGGVSQVQSLGNQAVSNIVTFLNIDSETDSNGYYSAEETVDDELETPNNTGYANMDRMSSTHSVTVTVTPAASSQIRKIFRFIWGQIRYNNDIVCYCCFILVFLWNFSLLSMVYPAALFLYALCVSSGPSYLFWVIMLIYTEVNILFQYLYQIIIHHCGLNVYNNILQRFGFPAHKMKAFFVISTLPLFMVYISTLLQRSITAKDGEWSPITELEDFEGRSYYQEELYVSRNWIERVRKLIAPIENIIQTVRRIFSTYWSSLTLGSESPPFFVQLSMKVDEWPEDAIQPERIESGINQLLRIVHEQRCKEVLTSCSYASKVRIQSIERSQENSDVALAVLEVIYSSPFEGCPSVKCYRSLTPAADVAKEILEGQRNGLLEEIHFPYPIISIIGGGRKEIDLYAYVFCADLAVFFLVTVFYQSIIKNNTKLLDVYQLEDQFPKEFVFILMVLFFLIVLDRVIYLCSFATSKVVFYLFNLVLFTYSVTKYAWYMDPSHHVGGLALRAIYLTKAISFTLQALQIRCGSYHKSTLYRQFLTCKVTQINYLGFRLYRALPFLYELRCVLDWSCTTTSLTMYDWLKLEDINASLFLVKCDVDLNRAVHQQGQKQTKRTKFCSGICLLFILICVIWAPMLMYSSGNPTNIANPIKDVTVHLDIKATGGRLTPFQTTLCEIFPWETLKFNDDFEPQNYLDTFNPKDIQLICCQPDASTTWVIPPVVQNKFLRSLDINMQIMFSWILIRERPKGKEVVKYELLIEDPPSSSEVKEVLNGTARSFRISNIYPRYFRVTGSGEIRLLEQTVAYVSADLLINNGSSPWWSFYDINPLTVEGCEGLAGPMAIIISEETPQGILGETLSKFSIWSLYISFVLAVGRFIRLQCSELRMRIPYENLPSCDRLIAICEGIYAARAEGELEVEEVLFWTLVKIYRSPHMLLEYTKHD